MFKRLLVALGAAALLIASASAMDAIRFVPLGYQQISAATLATATPLTVPAGATMALITVDAAPVRFRDDGTAPTATIGVELTNGQAPYEYSGNLSAIQFILVSGSPVLNVSFYRVGG